MFDGIGGCGGRVLSALVTNFSSLPLGQQSVENSKVIIVKFNILLHCDRAIIQPEISVSVTHLFKTNPSFNS